MGKRKKEPRKPTNPYGYVAFSKDGSVNKRMFQLSGKKTLQEAEVVDVFASGFNKHSEGREISDIKPLPENDQDFDMQVNGVSTLLQVTELVDRTFVAPLTADEYNACEYDEYIQKGFGEIPCGINKEARDKVLAGLIRMKIDMHYTIEPGKKFWLLIFSTHTDYWTEHSEAGVRRTSTALDTARAELGLMDDVLFDEIWYTNLITKPIRIWPAT